MRAVLLAIMMTVLYLGSPHARAAYPEKPIHLIVPFPPGATTDILARFVARRLEAKWNDTIIVENMPGAGGTIASNYVAKSRTDGYTLLFGAAGPNSVAPAVYKTLQYNTAQDFVLVSVVGEAANFLVVGPHSPVNSIADLIALARSKPGQVSYASPGNGSALQMCGVLLAEKIGVKMLHVPYKGAAPALIDVIAGRVDMMFNSGPIVADIKSKNVKALAVTTAKRAEVLPEVPTMIESGIPGYNLSSWYGVLAPSGIPDEIRTKLNVALGEILKEPATRAWLEAQGIEVVSMDAERTRRFFFDELHKWGDIVRASGVHIE